MHTVVLDLNGLLLDRRSTPAPGVEPDLVLGRTHVYIRPYARGFLRWLLQSFRVGVWSSAAPHNADPLVNLLLGGDRRRLRFVWNQSHCKPLCHLDGPRPVLAKPLASLFEAFPEVGRTRTLLIDDSEDKASLNPAHTSIHPPTWSVAEAPHDDFLAPGGELREWLTAMNGTHDVPTFVRTHSFAR